MRKYFKNFLIFAIVFTMVLSPFTVFADELADLNSQIEATKKKQADTINKIKQLDASISSISSSTGTLSQQLSSLKNQKKELEEQINILNSQIEEQDKNIVEFEKKLNDRKEKVQTKINYLYKLSFTKPNSILSGENDLTALFDEQATTNFIINIYTAEIKDYFSKIELAKNVKAQSQSDKKLSEEAMANVNSQIDYVEVKIAQNQEALAKANQSKTSLTSLSNELSSQLNFLSARQKQLLDAELAKMNSAGQTNQTPLAPGQYYFMGRGRDLIEGHGLGMSQWGAYGMAQKGWNYDQILKFYYTGVTIGDYTEPSQITVIGKQGSYPQSAKDRGYLTMDEYLAGIGEVPNSWPKEAVKAQVVAARTYVMGVCGNKTVCEICGTSRCQVYNGVTSADPTGLGKLQFVKETKGKVILHNGAPIVAYYSASHRGCSSKLSTVWGSTDRPYIQSVKDDSYAYKDYKSPNPYNHSQLIATYNWKWRTNGYSLEDLKNIFRKSSSLNVGDVKNISVQKDTCGRVSKITLVGSTGTKTLTGWDFRAIFNANTPFNDYIYSTEFDFYQN